MSEELKSDKMPSNFFQTPEEHVAVLTFERNERESGELDTLKDGKIFGDSTFPQLDGPIPLIENGRPRRKQSNAKKKFFSLVKLVSKEAEKLITKGKDFLISTFGEQDANNLLMLGTTVKEACERNKSNPLLPPVIEDAINLLMMQEGFKEEGIFRISCSLDLLKIIKKSYEDGNRLEVNGAYDVHILASLFKNYLMNIPETDRLFPDHVKARITNILAEDTKTSYDSICKILVENLSFEKLFLLNHVFQFLNLVVQNEKFTLMNARALHIIFTPSLQIEYDIFAFFLYNYKNIFSGCFPV